MNAYTDARGAFTSAQQSPRISGDLFDAFNRLRHLKNAYPDAVLAVLEDRAFPLEEHDEILYANVEYLRHFAPQMREILQERKERAIEILKARQSIIDTNARDRSPARKMADALFKQEEMPLIEVLDEMTLYDLRDMLADPADIIPAPSARAAVA